MKNNNETLKDKCIDVVVEIAKLFVDHFPECFGDLVKMGKEKTNVIKEKTNQKLIKKKFDTESTIKDPKLLGRFIRILRQDDGRSQRKLAILSGVNDSTISDLEAGVRKTIRKSTLAKIANGLRITPKQLLSCDLNITRSMPW